MNRGDVVLVRLPRGTSSHEINAGRNRVSFRLGTRGVGTRLLPQAGSPAPIRTWRAGGDRIDLIKAWTRAEGKPDQAILEAASNSNPVWPWQSEEEFEARRTEAQGL